jgi:hypothetical protein
MQLVIDRWEVGSSAAACRRLKKAGSDKPKADNPPTRKNSRRLIPEQSNDFRPVKSCNIPAGLPQKIAKRRQEEENLLFFSNSILWGKLPESQ